MADPDNQKRNSGNPTTEKLSSRVPLQSILCTEELVSRPPRSPDYEGDKKALEALGKAKVESPDGILQLLAETTLQRLRAQSAGVSLLSDDGKSFYWPAIAGIWKPHIGGGTPRDFGPCGDVLDYNSPLLFRQFHRRYSYFQPVTPPVEECLLVPFYDEGKAVGTIWAIAHEESRKFDSEDLRQLICLGKFAASAYKLKTKRVEAQAQRAQTTKERQIVQKKREQVFDVREQLVQKLGDREQAEEERLQDEIQQLQHEILQLQTNSHGQQDQVNELRRIADEYVDVLSQLSEDTQTRKENIQTIQENVQRLREDMQRQREEWKNKQSERKSKDQASLH